MQQSNYPYVSSATNITASCCRGGIAPVQCLDSGTQANCRHISQIEYMSTTHGYPWVARSKGNYCYRDAHNTHKKSRTQPQKHPASQLAYFFWSSCTGHQTLEEHDFTSLREFASRQVRSSHFKPNVTVGWHDALKTQKLPELALLYHYCLLPVTV